MTGLPLLRWLCVFCTLATPYRIVKSQHVESKVVECDDEKSGWLHCKDDRSRCVHDDAICDGVRDCEGEFSLRVTIDVGAALLPPFRIDIGCHT